MYVCYSLNYQIKKIPHDFCLYGSAKSGTTCGVVVVVLVVVVVFVVKVLKVELFVG